MKLPLTGGCLCGGLRYQIDEAPLATYACHCTDCQHLTSSAFSLAVTVPDRAFRLTRGDPRVLSRVADSGRTVARWVCAECGCWIANAVQPGGAFGAPIRRVRAGTLDDTTWLRPTAHFWTRSRQPWVIIPAGDQIYETDIG